MYHDVYKYISGGITPSSRTLRRYREEYGIYYNQLLQMTLKKAFDCGFTEFEHVVDGSINKAHNSKNNVITRKETQLLIEYLIGVSIDSEELNKLHKPAKKLLNNDKLNNSEKLNLLYDIKSEFETTK